MSSKVSAQKRRKGCVNSPLISFKSSWTHMVAKRKPFSRTSLTRMQMKVKHRMKLKRQEILLLLKPSKTSSTILYTTSWLMLVRAWRVWSRKSPSSCFNLSILTSKTMTMPSSLERWIHWSLARLPFWELFKCMRWLSNCMRLDLPTLMKYQKHYVKQSRVYNSIVLLARHCTLSTSKLLNSIKVSYKRSRILKGSLLLLWTRLRADWSTASVRPLKPNT